MYPSKPPKQLHVLHAPLHRISQTSVPDNHVGDGSEVGNELSRRLVKTLDDKLHQMQASPNSLNSVEVWMEKWCKGILKMGQEFRRFISVCRVIAELQYSLDPLFILCTLLSPV